MTQAVTPTDAATDQERDAMIQRTIQEISHIATLPEVTLKIIEVVEDPNSSAQDLNKIITNDPALGARILKVVNSAFYGLPGQIGSINRAIVLLGLNAVKNIAIAASLAKLFRGGQICPQFDARELWNHSISVACGTQLLSKAAGLGLPDEAFLAGLIHDMGIMVEMQSRRAKLIETFDHLEKNPSMTFRQAEEVCVGANHEQFGAALCKSWKFPASFGYVTGFHHRPLELAKSNRTLTSLVYIGDVISKQTNNGFTRDVEVDVPSQDVLDDLQLTLGHVEEVKAQLPQAMEEAAALIQGS